MEAAVRKAKPERSVTPHAAEAEPQQEQSSSSEIGASAGMPLWLQRKAAGVHAALESEEDEKRESQVQPKCASCSGGSTCSSCASSDDETLQRKAEGDSERGKVPRGGALHAVAHRGVERAAEPLPHFERIQSSFGKYDLRGVRTQIGGPATDANNRMGSVGYTVGDRIGFRTAPDVRLAAHEAAHVVHQRSGVQLKNGVGSPGDGYEEQADEVADAVARGESAETILDRGPRGSSGWAARAVAAPEPVQDRTAPSPGWRGSVAAATARGTGEPLSLGTRTRVSSLLGHDLEHVRVHADEHSTRAAESLRAKAFTVGSHVYLNQARVSPQSPPGERTLVHELAHVAQYDEGRMGGGGTGFELSSTGDETEREARAVADRAGQAASPPEGSADGSAARAHGAQTHGAPAAPPAGGKVSRDILDDAADVVGGAVNEITDLSAGALIAIVRTVAPVIADLIEKGPTETIKAALEAAVHAFLAGVGMGDLDIGATFTTLTTAFSAETIAGLFTGEGGSCDSFVSGLNALRDLGERFMNSPVVEGIQSFFTEVTEVVGAVAKLVLEPGFEAVKAILGAEWEGIAAIGRAVWSGIQAVRDASSAAFEWVAEQLGFDSATGEGGLTDWISTKASEIWETIKETVQPIIGPLEVVGGAIAMLTGVGELYLIIEYAPRVVEAVQWLWTHKDDPDIVRSAHEQMGDSILPELLEAGSSFANVVESAIQSFVEKLGALAQGFLELLGAVTGVPLLDMATSFIQTVTSALNRAVEWGTTFVANAVTKIRTGVQQLYAFCEPYIEVLTSIGLAILNPEMIPVIIAGWAWRALPDCVKPPIIDLLLDAVIGILEAMPDFPLFGLLWPIIKAGVLGFARTIRALGPDEKITITNRLARIMSGSSPQFLVGFVVGVLKGLWDMLVMPFEMLWQLASGIAHLADWIGGVVSEAFTPASARAARAATGTATAHAAAAATSGAAHAGASASTATRASAEHVHAVQTRESVAAAHEAAPAITADNMPEVVERVATRRSSERSEERASATAPPAAQAPAASARPAPAAAHNGAAAPAAGPAPATAGAAAGPADMADRIRPPASRVAEQFMPAVQEYFSGGEGMTLDDFVGYLGQMWDAVLGACESLGATIAEKASELFLRDSGEYDLGYDVGYVVGMIAFQAVLDYFTAGLFEAVPILEEILAAPAAMMEEVLGLLSELGEFILEGVEELGATLSEAGGGALEEVLGALGEIGEDLVQFGRELLEEFGLVAEEEAAVTEEALAETEAAVGETEAAVGEGEQAAAETEEEAAQAEQHAEQVEREHLEAEAEAQVLLRGAEAEGVPAMAAALALDSLKAQFEWIDHFEAEPEGPGTSAIYMIASRKKIALYVRRGPELSSENVDDIIDQLRSKRTLTPADEARLREVAEQEGGIWNLKGELGETGSHGLRGEVGHALLGEELPYAEVIDSARINPTTGLADEITSIKTHQLYTFQEPGELASQLKSEARELSEFTTTTSAGQTVTAAPGAERILSIGVPPGQLESRAAEMTAQWRGEAQDAMRYARGLAPRVRIVFRIIR
jgi:hypothetical protein